jgi:sugar phosphate isomerase/epimerase
MENRRSFIKKAGLAGVSLSFLSSTLYATKSVAAKSEICYFTKHLQWLDFEDLAMALQEAGFDGADLTVRTKGHIEPVNAGRELPKAVAAMAKRGLSIPMVVSSVQSAKDPGVDDYLMALADNGVKYYRMGYLNYDYAISIEKNLASFHSIFQGLAEKNSKYNLCGVYQNHAGTRLGASIWDLYLSIKDIDPELIGCQFDVRHATYEGGQSWENDFRCIKDHIRTTVVKDFYWTKDENGKWKNQNVLMGQGMVDFEKYFKLYNSSDIPGPITNHSEYELLSKQEEQLSKTEKMKIAISRLQQDVDFTRNFLK